MTVAKERLNLRIREDDRTLISRVAELRRESLTQFLVESGRERAERVLADRRDFTIGAREWQDLTEAMDRPAEAKPELVELFSRHKSE